VISYSAVPYRNLSVDTEQNYTKSLYPSVRRM